jgi:hypothetical protein
LNADARQGGDRSAALPDGLLVVVQQLRDVHVGEERGGRQPGLDDRDVDAQRPDLADQRLAVTLSPRSAAARASSQPMPDGAPVISQVRGLQELLCELVMVTIVLATAAILTRDLASVLGTKAQRPKPAALRYRA